MYHWFKPPLMVIFALLSGSLMAGADKAALSAHYMPEELLDITVGDKTTTVIRHNSRTSVTKGVMVFLVDASREGANQQSVAGVASELNTLGWASIRASVPKIPLQTKAQEKTEENNGATTDGPTARVPTIDNTITNEAFAQHQQYLTALLQALVPITEEYPGFWVVVAEGSTAAWLSKIYGSDTITSPDALVLLAPYWQQTDLNKTIAGQLAATRPPLLMLDFQDQSHWANTTYEARKTALVKARKLHARHRYINASRYNMLFNQDVAYQIQNWTRHMDW